MRRMGDSYKIKTRAKPDVRLKLLLVCAVQLSEKTA